jgi:glutathione S-transferase
MITIHHLENSRSQRVLWLLEELGIAYTVKRYERNTETMLAPPELRAIHPLGKSPVLDEDGLIVAETGAIFEYVIDTHADGRLRPARGTDAARAYTYWLHYAEGSAMSPLLLKLVFANMPARAPLLLRPLVKGIAAKAQNNFVDPQLAAHTAHWEDELSKTPWFAGANFSAADIMMSFPLEAAATRADSGVGPSCIAFLKRIHERPAYQRALNAGGPYAYA